MNRRQVAWLVLGVVLVIGAIAAPEAWLYFNYREVERVGVESFNEDSLLGYQKMLVRRWEEGESYTPAYGDSFVCVWYMTGGVSDFHSQSVVEREVVAQTFYYEDGSVRSQLDMTAQWQRAEALTSEPPWPHPIPYPPAEVRQLIYEAKLYVQEAAERGEVQLPAGWETVQ